MTTARTAAVVFWVAATALAQPPLTTIQDVLYKADGTRFNGIAIITWTRFEAADTSNIATQSVTAKIVDGNLRVLLVATTDANPPSFYSVTYNGDGKVQFQETWNVPPSATPLRVRDVRGAAPVNPLEPPSQTPILESDVVGLVNDLALRPLKGPGFGVGRAALINDTGGIESVSGNPGDCVKVDGTSGPCGAGGPAFIDGEALGGIVDGGNSVFTIANAPDPPASLALYRNGILQKAGFDYTLSGATVTYLTGAIPQPADTLLAWYRLGGASLLGSQSLYPGAQVICSAIGSATSAAAFASLGTCRLPQGLLQSGDRLEIRFDLAHQGTAAGFEFQVLWAATVVVDRSAAAGDAMIAGRGEAGIYGSGTQLRAESWGTLLGFAAGVGDAGDSIAGPLIVDFRVRMLATTAEAQSTRRTTKKN
ncbi:MAG: hypothetical protein HYX25_04435 [Candidatus Solibacter usitatus]|nr:hypothetical protein [Candidatus Solibacter usitatus]